MATKLFKQAFTKEFAGISGECSSIEPDGGEVNRAMNLEYSVGNSLRGRVGCQTAGSNGFFAIFPYNYTRTQTQYDIVYDAGNTLSTTATSADGASISKLIALGSRAFVLDTMNVTITQTVAATYTWFSYVSGSNINFKILKNGVSILDTSLGDGVSSLVSIYSLLGTIDALADLSVAYTRGVCPPFAIVNGAQTSVVGATVTYGLRYTITVNAGHTFYPGDVLWFSDQDAGIVISRTATTIVYVGNQKTFTNAQVLGYMAQAASSFPISTVSSESGGVMTLSFPYWRAIMEGDATGTIFGYYGPFLPPAFLATSKTSTSFFAPPVAQNANGNLYVASSSSYSTYGASSFANNLIKIDGTQVVRAGLPTPSVLSGFANGAGVLTGSYKYKFHYRRVDAQGNITDGPLSVVYNPTPAANAWLLLGATIQYAVGTGFETRSCYKYTAESPAAGVAFMVDDNSAAPGLNAFIQPGDPICLLDNTAPVTGLSLGTLHRTVCTFYDGTTSPSSIKVADSSGYTIPNNTLISTGLTAVFYRTTAGGNQYYKLCEIPINGYSGGDPQFTDNVTDANLILQEQYIEVEIGKEHNAPPACSLVCEHQGGLVVARGPITPNTVSYSTTDGIEYFPTASNSFDVPSTQSGFITTIASDTVDRLAVCKEKAYYDVAGDLDGGSFSVNVRNEGDFGISSQASLIRVNNALIGVCKNGWMVIQDGQLDPYKFKSVSSRLINQAYNFQWATAVNDYFNRQYICSIPQVSGEPVTYSIDYSRNQIITLERSYPTKIDPVGGMAMIGDTLYHLSATSPYGVFRRLVRFNSNSPTSNDGDSFIDNTSAISYILESQPINFGEPGQLKSPIRIRVWSIPNDYVVEGWVSFAILLETGASPIAAYVGSGGTNNTSTTLTFATANDVLKDAKLVKCKCHFYIVRMTTNTIRTAPFITGYEIMFASEYEKEDFVK
jgi:hypothetical protein